MMRPGMMYPKAGRTGFTLLEVLSVMALFAVVIALLTATLGLLMRLREQEDRHDDQLSQLHEVASGFRKDIHQGIGFPKEYGDMKSSAKLLLVEWPKDRLVAWKDSDAGLERAEFKKGEKPKWSQVLQDLRKARGTFSREGDLVRLEISDQLRKTAPVKERLVVEAAIESPMEVRK